MKKTKKQQAREQLDAALPCDCGSYPHAPGCAFLSWCVSMTKLGRCNQCGFVLMRRLGWDESMECVVRQTWCKNGCQHSEVWVRPEDASPAEREHLGLVVKQR